MEPLAVGVEQAASSRWRVGRGGAGAGGSDVSSSSAAALGGAVLALLLVALPWLCWHLATALWPLRWTLAAALAAAEFCFYAAWFRPVFKRLDAIPSPCAPAGFTPAEGRRNFRRFIALTRALGPNGVDPAPYLSAWFCGTPFEQLRRGNVAEMLSYGFFFARLSDMTGELAAEPNKMVAELERALDVTFEPGYTPGVRFMSHLWEPLRAQYRPLLWYAALEALHLFQRLVMAGFGFEHHTLGGVCEYYTLGCGRSFGHGCGSGDGEAPEAAASPAAAAAAATAAPPARALSALPRDAADDEWTPFAAGPLSSAADEDANASSSSSSSDCDCSGLGGFAASGASPRANPLGAAFGDAAFAYGCGGGGEDDDDLLAPAAAGGTAAPPPTPRWAGSGAVDDDDGAAAATPSAHQPPPPSRRDPVLFLHGVGGLVFYLEMLRHVIALGHPVIVIDCKHVALRLVSYVPSVDEVTRELVRILDHEGIARVCVVGHSYGSFIASRLAKLHAERLAGLCLIDPVCFAMFMPRLLHTFIYRRPRIDWRHPDIMLRDLVLWFASRDVHIAATFARRFYWSELNLWPSEMPAGSTVILSGNDDLVAADETKRMLESAGHIKVLLNPHLFHGAFLLDRTSKAGLMAEVRDLLAAGGSLVRRMARPVVASTLSAAMSLLEEVEGTLATRLSSVAAVSELLVRRTGSGSLMHGGGPGGGSAAALPRPGGSKLRRTLTDVTGAGGSSWHRPLSFSSSPPAAGARAAARSPRPQRAASAESPVPPPLPAVQAGLLRRTGSAGGEGGSSSGALTSALLSLSTIPSAPASSTHSRSHSTSDGVLVSRTDSGSNDSVLPVAPAPAPEQGQGQGQGQQEAGDAVADVASRSGVDTGSAADQHHQQQRAGGQPLSPRTAAAAAALVKLERLAVRLTAAAAPPAGEQQLADAAAGAVRRTLSADDTPQRAGRRDTEG